jgi:hypothetical protein
VATNPHQARLERERSDIMRRQRNVKSFLANPWRIIDSVDRNNMIRDAQSQLLYLEREYERVCYELGRNPYPSVVRVPPAEVSRAETSRIRAQMAARGAVKDAPARRTVPGYVCKVMVPER